MLRSTVFIENQVHGDDKYLCRRTKKWSLFGVFDGVSDAEGKLGSNYCFETLKEKKLNTPEEVAEAVREVHEELIRKYGSIAQTTLSIIFIKDSIHTFNVGDSPIYLVNDTINLLSTFDSPLERPNELTQLIGAGDMRIHKKEAPLEKNSYILLMTDGISDNVSSEELKNICANKPSAKTVKKRLQRLIQKRKEENKGCVYEEFKDDDRTAIIIQVL